MTLDWQQFARCVDVPSEIFFDKADNGRFLYESEAKSICRRCSVQSCCADDALASKDRAGIWGGLSEQDRVRLRRQLRGDEEGFKQWIAPAVGRVADSVREETMRKLQGVLS